MKVLREVLTIRSTVTTKGLFSAKDFIGDINAVEGN
jgi:hypothetical protein